MTSGFGMSQNGDSAVDYRPGSGMSVGDGYPPGMKKREFTREG